MSKISVDSIRYLTPADLWAMYQYTELRRIEAQKAFDLYKAREYSNQYKKKIDYWSETLEALSIEINKRINEINPMYP